MPQAIAPEETITTCFFCFNKTMQKKLSIDSQRSTERSTQETDNEDFNSTEKRPFSQFNFTTEASRDINQSYSSSDDDFDSDGEYSGQKNEKDSNSISKKPIKKGSFKEIEEKIPLAKSDFLSKSQELFLQRIHKALREFRGDYKSALHLHAVVNYYENSGKQMIPHDMNNDMSSNTIIEQVNKVAQSTYIDIKTNLTLLTHDLHDAKAIGVLKKYGVLNDKGNFSKAFYNAFIKRQVDFDKVLKALSDNYEATKHDKKIFTAKLSLTAKEHDLINDSLNSIDQKGEIPYHKVSESVYNNVKENLNVLRKDGNNMSAIHNLLNYNVLGKDGNLTSSFKESFIEK